MCIVDTFSAFWSFVPAINLFSTVCVCVSVLLSVVNYLENIHFVDASVLNKLAALHISFSSSGFFFHSIALCAVYETFCPSDFFFWNSMQENKRYALSEISYLFIWPHQFRSHLTSQLTMFPIIFSHYVSASQSSLCLLTCSWLISSLLALLSSIPIFHYFPLFLHDTLSTFCRYSHSPSTFFFSLSRYVILEGVECLWMGSKSWVW